MSSSPPDRHRPSDLPFVDRRAASGTAEAKAPLRQLKGMLERPLRLESDGGRLRVVLVDRRKAPAGDQEWLLAPLRAEVRARVLADPRGTASSAMRHLKLVHKELGRKGWAGLDRLPATVLSKARDQAEMINGVNASTLLVTLIERLRAAQVLAEKRETAGAKPVEPEQVVEELEVSEGSLEEFEEMQRSWAELQPPASNEEPAVDGRTG